MTASELTKKENEVRDLWEAGELPYLTHLTSGNEEWLTRYFHESVNDGDWFFCSHRCHMQYILAGNTDLIEKVKAGKSMFLYSKNFFCSAIVGGSCAIAAGKALAIKLRGGTEHVHCFQGDGATDQGAFWEALRFAEGRDLPITFIIEDNNGQCGVDPDTRWGSGWPMIERLMDSRKVRYYRYKSAYPHAGNFGPDGKPTRPPIKWPRE